MTYTITPNTQYNSLEIYFDEKPDADVREFLKGLRFRWHKMKKCWYGRADEKEVSEGLDKFALAQKQKAAEEAVQTGGKIGDGYLGGGEWTGCNVETKGYLRYSEINKIVKKEMQRRYKGITFKTRGESYSGGQSSRFYIYLSTEQLFKPKEECISEFLREFRPNGWYVLRDSQGKEITTWGEKLNENEKRTAAEMYYDHLVNSYQMSAHNVMCGGNYITPMAEGIYKTAKSLYMSFIHDSSNAMVDYFDRNLYDDYYFCNTDNLDKKESWEV